MKTQLQQGIKALLNICNGTWTCNIFVENGNTRHMLAHVPGFPLLFEFAWGHHCMICFRVLLETSVLKFIANRITFGNKNACSKFQPQTVP